MILHAILRNEQVAAGTTVPVSTGLLHDAETFFDALGGVRRHPPEPSSGSASPTGKQQALAPRLVDDASTELEGSRRQMHGAAAVSCGCPPSPTSNYSPKNSGSTRGHPARWPR